MHKTAFVTVVTDNYSHYFMTFLKSILKHNPGFNIPYYVIGHPWKLSKKSIDSFYKIYDNIIVKMIDEENYIKHGKGNIRYASLESFRLKDYDKVIYFGSDVLCLGDIKELYDIEVDAIGMTKELRRINTYNNNCMIINGNLCSEMTYNALMQADYSEDKSCYGTDQKLYTLFFRGRITDLEHKWNVLVSETNEIKFEDIKFLHYIYKPDIEIGKAMLHDELINLWEQYRSL